MDSERDVASLYSDEAAAGCAASGPTHPVVNFAREKRGVGRDWLQQQRGGRK
jgi:hypothetical protein